MGSGASHCYYPKNHRLVLITKLPEDILSWQYMVWTLFRRHCSLWIVCSKVISLLTVVANLFMLENIWSVMVHMMLLGSRTDVQPGASAVLDLNLRSILGNESHPDVSWQNQYVSELLSTLLVFLPSAASILSQLLVMQQ